MEKLLEFIVSKKYLVIAAGLAILVFEMVFFVKPWQWQSAKVTLPAMVKPPKQEEAKLIAGRATLKLVSQTDSFKVGQDFVVEVVLDSPEKKAEAVDVVVEFEPYFLEAVAVTPSGLFSEYPQARIDKEKNRVLLSGVSSLTGSAGVNQGVVGTFTFRPKQIGVTELKFLFKPGNTTDTNVVVADSLDDALGKVENLNLIIQ